MSRLARIRNNLLSLTAAEIIAKVFGVFLYILLARYLGPEDYGIYAVAISFYIIFGLIANLGLDSFIIKEIAVNANSAQKLFSIGIILKFFGGLVSFILAVFFCFIMSYDSITRWAIIVFSLTLMFTPINKLYDSIFCGFQRMEFSAFMKVGRSLLTFLIITIMIVMHQDIIMIVTAHLITSFCLLLIFYFFIVRKYFCKFLLDFDRMEAVNMLKGGFTYLLVGAIYIITTRTDVLMLSKLSSRENVGFYDAGSQFVMILLIFPSMISQLLFPVLSEQFGKQKEKLAYTVNFIIKILVAIGVPISFGIVILAPQIIATVLGEKYLESTIVLQIMGGGISIVFIRSILGWILAAIDKANLMMWSNLTTLILNVCLNLVLIPRYGHAGAAIATILSMVFVTFIVLILIKYSINGTRSIAFYYLKPVASAIVMSIFLVYFVNYNIFVVILFGAIIYIGCFLLLKGIAREEWSVIRRMAVKS